MVPLSVEIFLREWGLREGRWKRDKRGLGTRGTPRMVEYWWTWPINRLWLVTDGRRRDKDGARGVRRGVGLWWGWVQGGSWEHWRNRCKRWSCLEVSGGVLSSASVGPGTKKHCETHILQYYLIIDKIVPWAAGITSPSVCLPLCESGGAVSGDLIEQRDSLLVAQCIYFKCT